MSLTAFLAKNALKVENVKFVPSKRFVDENTKKPMRMKPFGKPVPSGFLFPARRTSIRRKLTMICTLGSWLWPVRCSPT